MSHTGMQPGAALLPRIPDESVCSTLLAQVPQGEYAAAGKTLPKIGLYLENEPIYWPYSAFEESPEGGADFNAATIAAAKKDG